MGGTCYEFLSREIPERMNFPRRTASLRVVDAILVVEAAHTGGALITAEMQVPTTGMSLPYRARR
jgi:predicted Rossmann fold nucleotide-binding protein DprA/Smf involved in DNA uptake